MKICWSYPLLLALGLLTLGRGSNDSITYGSPALAQTELPLRGITVNNNSVSASANVRPTILRGGLFKSGSVNNLQTLDIEGVRSSVEFMNGLTKQKMAQESAFHNPLSYTLDRLHFMGEPLIAKLSNDDNTPGTEDVDATKDYKRSSDSYDYYLIVFHFNVPAVKYSIVPTSYGFARFNFDMQVFSPVKMPRGKETPNPTKIVRLYSDAGCKFSSPDVQAAVGANALWPVRVISIYPVNEVLSVAREDTNQFEAQFKPEYQGAAAGSFTYTKTLKDNFSFDLPKVIGTGSSAGSVGWTYYPAKAQPLMLGSKTTMAIIAVPSGLNYKHLALRVLAKFDYQLTKAKLPLWWGQSVYDAKEVSLVNVPSLKEVTALHSIDLPKEIRQTVSDVFKADVKDKPKVVLLKGKDHDYLMDPDTGSIYLPSGGAWKAIELIPPTPAEDPNNH